MDIDDDEPPLLVSQSDQNDAGNIAAEMEDLQVTKVPITLITGRKEAHR